jgi:hypothetical protein
MQSPFRLSLRQPRASLALLLAIAITGSSLPMRAETDGCTSFSWPLAIEREWLTNANLPSYTSGSSLPTFPDHGFALKLNPVQDAEFPFPPQKPATRGWGGFVILPPPDKPGFYQITLAENAWIDVIQAGPAWLIRHIPAARTARPCAKAFVLSSTLHP